MTVQAARSTTPARRSFGKFSLLTAPKVATGAQTQPPGDNVAGDLNKAPLTSISVSTQPHECLLNSDAELLGEHPGGLVDLGAAPR
jgi:hypothetical protein